MIQNEISTILDNILIKNDFWFSEISECREQNAEILNNICSIFSLKKALDFTFLIAAIQLLSNDSEQIIKYFLEDNADLSFSKTYKTPGRKELMIVATAFLDSPLFFSKCWNMVALLEAEIPEDSNIIKKIYIKNITEFQIINFDNNYESAAAGTKKTNNITSIPVDPIGELQIQGYEGDGETKPYITFVLFLEKEYQNLKFEMNIEFIVDGKTICSKILKDYGEADYDISSESKKIDYSNGIRITKIEWKPL